MDDDDRRTEPIEHLTCRRAGDLPPPLTPKLIADFLDENMKPWNDTPADTLSGVEMALSGEDGAGFVSVAMNGNRLCGALVMLGTGMEGFVPPNLLLFVAVDPSLRGRGVGGGLIRHALRQAAGDVKLHVDFGNPAVRLYERIGFERSYLDMRLHV